MTATQKGTTMQAQNVELTLDMFDTVDHIRKVDLADYAIGRIAVEEVPNRTDTLRVQFTTEDNASTFIFLVSDDGLFMPVKQERR
jgi:hypothetical protein